MKHLTITLLTLLVLGSCGESGYESYEECLLREVQECSPSDCRREARDFCKNYQGKQYSKTFREEYLLRKQKSEECLSSGVPSWSC